MSNLYLRIKELADDRHISLAQLERDLDFSNGIISTWKKGRASVDKLTAVAKYFDVNSDYLLGISDDPTPAKPTSTEAKHAIEIGGLFRSVASKQDLSEKEQADLQEDLQWYMEERARRIKGRNEKKD